MSAGAILSGLQKLRAQVQSATGVQNAQAIFVNDLYNLVKYDQAIFYGYTGWPSQISAVGVPNRNAPYVQSLRLLHEKILAQTNVPTILSAQDLDGVEGFSKGQGIWAPLRAGGGVLLLSKSQSFTDGQAQILDLAVHSLQNNLLVAQARKTLYPSLKLFSQTAVVILCLVLFVGLLALVPVTNSLIVTTQIISDKTRYLRAPLEGVIDKIHVQPGQLVQEGQLLISLDDQRISSSIAIAQAEYQALAVEFEQESLGALDNSIVPARLATLRAELAEKREEIDFLQTQLDKHIITSPISGIVILPAADDLRARPVQIGDTLLEIADPDALAIEAMLDVSGAVQIDQGSRIRVFPNADPLNVIEGVVSHVNPRATALEDGRFAYAIRAAITANAGAGFLGQKGYGRIETGRTNAFLFVVAKPVSWARQTFGF